MSSCEIGIAAVTTGDACSMAVTGLFSDDLSNIANLYTGDCPARFQEFANGCTSLIGNTVSLTDDYLYVIFTIHHSYTTGSITVYNLLKRS